MFICKHSTKSCISYDFNNTFHIQDKKILDGDNFLTVVYLIHLKRHTYVVAYQERHVLVVPIHSIQLVMVHMLEAGLHTMVPWEVNMVVEHHYVNHL